MNTLELKAEIAKSGRTNRALARELGISEQALYNKIQGKTDFKNSEMKKLAEVLSLSRKDVNLIFFGI